MGGHGRPSGRRLLSCLPAPFPILQRILIDTSTPTRLGAARCGPIALGLSALFLVSRTFAAAPSTGSGQAPGVPSYSLGDTAAADVVSPMPLVVFDAARTELLRKAEAAKVPAIFRVVPDAPQQADRLLRDAFEARRGEFVASLQKHFGHPVPLLSVEAAQPVVGELAQAFRDQHPDFPLRPQLVELWAFGNAGDAMLDDWRKRLRALAAAQPYVRADVLPEGERLTTPQVRIVDVDSAQRKLTLAAVDAQGRNLARTNLTLLSTIRREGQAAANDAEAKTVLAFVAGFLTPNCVFDVELTRQARARRTDAVHVADRYAVGETIVKEGDEITLKAKLALDELRARSAAQVAAVEAAVERSQRTQAEAAMSAVRERVEATSKANRWLWGGLAALAALCGFSLWRWRKGHRALALAAEHPSLALIPAADATLDETAWRQRAVEAEARAERAAALLRSSLLPHLARWMMNELVRRLVSQRSELVTSQQKAEKEVAELVQRLDQLHAPLEERLRAYEKRIAELETELAVKGQQNADLIKAKIETTRKKLEGERGHEPMSWN